MIFSDILNLGKEKNDLLYWTKQELEKIPELMVKTNTKYHGFQVPILAEDKNTKERLFLYVTKTTLELGHLLDLHDIRDYNDNELKFKSGCKYLGFSEQEVNDGVSNLSHRYNIPIIKNKENFKHYLSDNYQNYV